MCNWERESRALSILSYAFRLGFSTRQKVPTICCHQSISWPPPIFTIMSEKEVLKRAGMSAEKERKLDAMFAAWILRKRAKRLGSKQKAKLATQVGTSVDNVQYHWECYKRKHFKKVR